MADKGDRKEKLLIKADEYARRGKHRKAISAYQEAIQADPNDLRTRLRLSELLYQSGRREEALETLQFVGDFYRKHGFLLKSVAVYKKMLEVEPSRSDLHGTLAQLYFQLGMAPDALKQFKAQIRALVKQGKLSESLFVVRSMLELDAANIPDRLRLAERFSRQGLYDEAADEYRRVLTLLDKQGKKQEWARVAMRYLHHVPDAVNIRRSLVEQLVQEDDHVRALQHLHVCLAADPSDPKLLEAAATCFEMLGQPEKAVLVLKALAAACRERGLKREEEDAWTRVLQLDPRDAAAGDALNLGVPPEPVGEVVLEREMPDDFHAPVIAGLDETVLEDPSFAEEWAADDKTLVQAVDDDLFKELEVYEESPPSVDLSTLRRAVESGRLMTPKQLADFGVILSPSDREELEFFLSSGLKDEAMAILREICDKVSRGPQR